MIKVASDDETPLMMVWNTLALDDAMLELIREVVAVTPLTFEVAMFPAVENVLLVIAVVVATTPLIVVVRMFPLLVKRFVVICGVRVVVAMTPLIVVVKRFVEVA